MRPLSKHVLVITSSLVAVALAVWAAAPTPTHKQLLAADLPPGALLTIESPDFGSLLHNWNTSPEQAAWLKSTNYSAFANSRLFSRLSDAQEEFAGVSGTEADAAFLQQIAGKESIFAWYDISKLEFVYISHLAPGQTARVDLLQQRGKFSRRESGGDSFYVKTSSSSGPSDASADDAGPSTPRTVAFATRGDWLILGTREDLVANALLLMQQQEAGKAAQSSAASDGWYAAAEAAGPAKHGELHMLLDLQRITATPAFRTYWVQRNVTDTRQDRAAVVDLYREAHSFREERVLLPNDPDSDGAAEPDLAAVEALVPERAGVYRATALPQPTETLAALDEKLLTRAATSTASSGDAPAGDLSVSQPGNASDFETRIDAIGAAPEPASAASAPLLAALQEASVSAMLTIERTDPPAAGALFVPIRSAVILRSTNPWNSAQLQASLLTALRSHLTVGDLGLAWTPSGNGAVSLGATRPLLLVVDGSTAILANDPALMSEIVARRQTPATSAQPATLIAGFRHSQERANFARLTASLAHASVAGDDAPNPMPNAGQSPDFFSGSVGSLSKAFRALASERLVERRDGPVTRQTVVYTWQTP